MDVIRSAAVQATWFDPRYGVSFTIHRSGNEGIQTFSPPSQGRGADWILVLDDANAGFPPPGQPAP